MSIAKGEEQPLAMKDMYRSFDMRKNMGVVLIKRRIRQ
jgi:hypothetical protein